MEGPLPPWSVKYDLVLQVYSADWVKTGVRCRRLRASRPWRRVFLARLRPVEAAGLVRAGILGRRAADPEDGKTSVGSAYDPLFHDNFDGLAKWIGAIVTGDAPSSWSAASPYAMLSLTAAVVTIGLK